MSKLLSIYSSEKAEDPDKILLFKSGIFYIALDKDALFLSSNLGFKLTNLNNEIKKCGFPIASADKYLTLISSLRSFKIIDMSNLKSYTIENYSIENRVLVLLKDIEKINVDNISISEAYKKLEDFKSAASKILSSKAN